MKKILITTLLMIIMITAFSYDSYAIVTSTIDDSLKPIDLPTTLDNFWNTLKTTYTSNNINYYYYIKYSYHRNGTLNNRFFLLQTKNPISKFELVQYDVSTVDIRIQLPFETTSDYATSGLTDQSIQNQNIVLIRTSGNLSTVVMNSLNIELIASKTYASIVTNEITPTQFEIITDNTHQIPNSQEYLYITLPPEGYKTIDKFMTYNVMYSIAADQVSDVTISPKDITGDPFSNNTNIKSFDVVNHTATIENGYLKGTLQLLVDYNSTFVGPIGTQIKVTNTVTNRELSITRNAEIVAFVDADGDGIDDNTGQDQFNRIEVPTLDDLTLTDAIDTLTGVIPSIITWIGSIVSLIAIVFGFLPTPVLSLLVLIMIIIGVTTLLKVLRG